MRLCSGVRFFVGLALPLHMFGPVSAAQSVGSPPLASGSHHSIEGVVVDSLHRKGLAAAEVVLEGTIARGVTDSIGRFRLTGVPAGEYRVGVFHPLLDTLSISLATSVVKVPLDPGRVVMLAVPSASTLVRAMCRGSSNAEEGLAIVGRVLDPDTDDPVPAARVFLSWSDWIAGKDVGLRRTPRKVVAVTDATGAFRLCGLPSELNALLLATNGKASTAEVDVASTRSGMLLKSLTLERDTLGARAKRASVSGTVRNASGAPLSGARITVSGSGASATSGPGGEFILRGLPSGTRNVVVRHVGYAQATLPVDLTSRETRRVAAILERQAQIMDPVMVEARRDRALASVGFSDRRRSGNGDFRTRAEIERMHPRVLSDVLRTMRGVRVVMQDGRVALASSRDDGGCVQLVVDGSQWRSFTPGDQDDLVLPEDIAGIEVYSGSSVPPEFESAGNRGCLTVVVWTRGRVRDDT